MRLACYLECAGYVVMKFRPLGERSAVGRCLNPTSARLLPVNAEPATVSRSWQARTLRLTAAGPSADDAEARRSQVEQ